MSEPTISANTMSEIPMTPLAAPASIYPASENIMTTQQNQANSGEQEQQDRKDDHLYNSLILTSFVFRTLHSAIKRWWMHY